MVRAKFKVESITEFEAGKKIDLKAVTCGSKENETFFKWTPNANISIGIVNGEAAKQFEVCKEYYVDFTMVDAASENLPVPPVPKLEEVEDAT